MYSLRELQQACAQAILHGRDEEFTRHIYANGLTGGQRLNIYRNNVYTNLTSALRDIYLVIHRLVGDDFFSQTAHQYIPRFPSTSGNLQNFGANFAEYLTQLSDAADLPYLQDVARLEWAAHQVFHAADRARFDVDALAAVPQGNYGHLQFHLHPASRLLLSAFPVLRIWQVNQPDYTGEDTIDLRMGGDRLLVIRRNDDIEFEQLSVGEYALLQAFTNGADCTDACAAAFADEPNFDLGARLRWHVAQGTIVDWD